MDEGAIHDILSRMLLASRLPPGTKLGEHRLAAAFGVTRERIRKVLHRLGHERLIDLYPNRGAFVVSPGLGETRAIYEARRILEGGIVARLSESLSQEQFAQIRTLLAAEVAAAERGDRPAAIRLSGRFHMMLAEMTGNSYVVQQMRELVGRTAMLVAFFEPESASQCGCQEHADVFDALRRRDGAGASRAMAAHLSLIETRLKPLRSGPAAVDLDEVLAAEIAAARRAAPAVRPRRAARA
jgi:DNA-binding GntR family transcriptional regulator